MDKTDKFIKIVKEEGGMTTGSTAGKPGFSSSADAEGPVAGADPLMFAKPQKRKLGPWIKAAIKMSKKGKKK